MGGGGSRPFISSPIVATGKPLRVRELRVNDLPTILKLPIELVSDVLVSWLNIRDLRRLDIALSNEVVLRYLVSSATVGIEANGENFNLVESERLYRWIANRRIPLQVCHFYKEKTNTSALAQSIHIDRQVLSHSRHRLVELALNGCKNLEVVYQIIQAMTEVNPNLRTLYLRDSTLPEDLVILMPQLTALKSLWLMNCTSAVTDYHAAHTVHSTSVQSLCTSGRYPFSLVNSTTDAVAYPSLTALDLYAPMRDFNLPALCKPDKLTKLDLSETECFYGHMLSFLKQVESLQKLTLSNCENMLPEVWKSIFRRCRVIEAVSISTDDGYFGSGGFTIAMCIDCAESLIDLRLSGLFFGFDVNCLARTMKRCTRLQRLELASKCARITSSSLQKAIQSCHALTDMVLRLGPLDDALLQCIGENCPLLQSLGGDIATCPHSEDPELAVSEDGMDALVRGCRYLKMVTLLTERDGAECTQAHRLWGAKYPQITFG